MCRTLSEIKSKITIRTKVELLIVNERNLSGSPSKFIAFINIFSTIGTKLAKISTTVEVVDPLYPDFTACESISLFNCSFVEVKKVMSSLNTKLTYEIYEISNFFFSWKKIVFLFVF